jgi:hypothetical protein
MTKSNPADFGIESLFQAQRRVWILQRACRCPTGPADPPRKADTFPPPRPRPSRSRTGRAASSGRRPGHRPNSASAARRHPRSRPGPQTHLAATAPRARRSHPPRSRGGRAGGSGRKGTARLSSASAPRRRPRSRPDPPNISRAEGYFLCARRSGGVAACGRGGGVGRLAAAQWSWGGRTCAGDCTVERSCHEVLTVLRSDLSARQYKHNLC